jgi:hypothetical protein
MGGAVLVTTAAVAVVNSGRWIAECPREHCANAVRLEPKQTAFHCGGGDGCRLVAEVLWPPDADEIDDVLSRRPVPGTRNWAPAGHRQAIADGFPDGQSVSDLLDENRQYGVS